MGVQSIAYIKEAVKTHGLRFCTIHNVAKTEKIQQAEGSPQDIIDAIDLAAGIMDGAPFRVTAWAEHKTGGGQRARLEKCFDWIVKPETNIPAPAPGTPQAPPELTRLLQLMEAAELRRLEDLAAEDDDDDEQEQPRGLAGIPEPILARLFVLLDRVLPPAPAAALPINGAPAVDPGEVLDAETLAALKRAKDRDPATFAVYTEQLRKSYPA
jgi:hypothetical protein